MTAEDDAFIRSVELDLRGYCVLQWVDQPIGKQRRYLDHLPRAVSSSSLQKNGGQGCGMEDRCTAGCMSVRCSFLGAWCACEIRMCAEALAP